MTIRIAGTEFSLKNRAYEIYIQGCSRNCPGCQNPTTHSFSQGRVVEISQFLNDLYKKIKPFIEDGLIQRIFVSGGDLLCQNKRVIEEFSDELLYHFHNLELWLFTGAEEEEIPNWIWWYFDVVKCGRYKEELRTPDGTFPASDNQKLILGEGFDLKDDLDFMGEIKWR